jgi:hypothetical protein
METKSKCGEKNDKGKHTLAPSATSRTRPLRQYSKFIGCRGILEIMGMDIKRLHVLKGYRTRGQILEGIKTYRI